jgi:hypothetical protein
MSKYQCKGPDHSGTDEPTYGWPDDGIPILCKACWLSNHSPGNYVRVGVDGERWDAQAFNRGESGVRQV